MRLLPLAALAGLILAPALASAQTPAAQSAPSKFVYVDDPPFCNAAGLAPSREQAAGYAIPADKGGGVLAYVDKSHAECQQVVGKAPTETYRRATICPLGSGRTQIDGVWYCRTQKLAGS